METKHTNTPQWDKIKANHPEWRKIEKSFRDYRHSLDGIETISAYTFYLSKNLPSPKLMAAAPEMLEALEEAMDMLKIISNVHPSVGEALCTSNAITKAESAIKKATE